MRIGGIASGIDTESMVRQLMQVERQPLDRFFQRKQTIEWQRDAYRDMNLQLRTLEEKASSIRLPSAFNTREATSSNTSAFSVTANSTVQNGTYHFKVDQVATNTRNISTEQVNIDLAKSLSSQGVTSGGVFTIATVKEDGTLNQKEINVDTSKSLNDVLNQINEANIGVKAYYDSAYKKVVIERRDTGEFNGILSGDEAAKNEIIFGGSNVDFIENVLHIDPTKEVHGQNAKVQFENPIFGGEPIIQESQSNRITFGGLSFYVTEETNGFESVTVTSNTDQAFQNITEFVEKYNETIAGIQAKLNEPRHRDFPPLTDEQRSELSEREVELWDEKAMSGLLRRDPILTSVLNQMRMELSSTVQTTGQFTHLSQMGITTTRNYLDGGKLEIDEEKLRQALELDPDSVHQLFNNVADPSLTSLPRSERTTEQNRQMDSQTGLIGRLRRTISAEMGKITNRAGNENRTNQQFTLGREMINVERQIDTFQRRLIDIENRYWAQFTRMEQAVNQANAQGDSLMQFMGGL